MVFDANDIMSDEELYLEYRVLTKTYKEVRVSPSLLAYYRSKFYSDPCNFKELCTYRVFYYHKRHWKIAGINCPRLPVLVNSVSIFQEYYGEDSGGDRYAVFCNVDFPLKDYGKKWFATRLF